MIKIKIDFYTGDTYITKGTCRLFICGYSSQCNLWPYQKLLNNVPLTNGSVEFSESRRMINAFNVLKYHILAQDIAGCNSSREDSVNLISRGCRSTVQEIMEASVLA